MSYKFRRREFLGAMSAPLLAQANAAPPNVVVIVAEGVGAWMPGCYGNKTFATPGIDEIARAGLRFLNSFSLSPSAASGTSCLLTGRSPMQMKPSEDAATIAAHLFRRDYRVESAVSGPPEAITEKATGFLKQQKAGRPFALTVTYPSVAEPLSTIPAKHRDRYAKETFDAIGWSRASANLSRKDRERFNGIVEHLRSAAAMLSYVDSQIAEVVQALRAGGLALETLLLFTSANGSHLGRNGLWSDAAGSEPQNLFEPAVHTPAIWSWPGRIPVQAVRPEVVSHADVFPTLCEAAAAPVPPGLCGRSYLTMLRNRPLDRKNPWQGIAFAALGDARMARDNRYKLILRASGGSELYDLRADAAERVNRYEDPGYLNVRDALTRQVEAWTKRCG